MALSGRASPTHPSLQWCLAISLMSFLCQPCFAASGAGSSAVAYVQDDREFAAAVANPTIEVAVITVPYISLKNESFNAFELPIPLERNFTILGARNLTWPEWPLLDFGFIKGKVRLGSNVAFVMQNIVVYAIRDGSYSQAQDMDWFTPVSTAKELTPSPIFSPSPPNQLPSQALATDLSASAVVNSSSSSNSNNSSNSSNSVVMEDLIAQDARQALAQLQPPLPVLIFKQMAFMNHLCNVLEIQINSVKSIRRPAAFPGNQETYHDVPQPPNCTNATAWGVIPVMQRCWPNVNHHVNVAMNATNIDPVTSLRIQKGYYLWLFDAYEVCMRRMPKSCSDTFGAFGCFSQLYKGQGNVTDYQGSSQSVPPSGGGVASSTAKRDGGRVLGPVLGGVFAGVVVLICLLVVVTTTVRRRRRNARAAAGGSSSSPHAQVPSGSDGDFSPLGAVLVNNVAAPINPEAADARNQETDAWKPSAGQAAGCQDSCGNDGDQEATVASILSSQPGAADQMPVTAFTPIRSDVQVLNTSPGNEVTLLPLSLGKGTFGRVVVGLYQGRRVAVKLLHELFEFAEPLGAENIAHLAQEFAVLGRCCHPNIVRLLAVCLQPQRPCLVMELCDTSLDALLYGGGDNGPGRQHREQKQLQTMAATAGGGIGADGISIEFALELAAAAAGATATGAARTYGCGEGGPDEQQQQQQQQQQEETTTTTAAVAAATLLPMPKVLHIALQVARGLEYLHPTIVHRDLKPANVLLRGADGSRPEVKLADFGLSRLRSTTKRTCTPEAGTPAYMAPECFDLGNDVITHDADIYSFGCLLWAMLTGKKPWYGYDIVRVATEVTLKSNRLPLYGISPERCPARLRHLIHSCWERDPKRRPAAAEIVKELEVLTVNARGGGGGGGASG